MSTSAHAEISPTHYGAGEDAKLAVYGVHGRGQSPEFIKELAARIGLAEIAWTLPAAAENSWYPGGFMEPQSGNRPQLDDALATVGAHLDQLLAAREDGGPDVVVLGFSQGACLLAEHLLTHQPAIDAAVLHTGGYLGPEGTTAAPKRGGGSANLAVEMFCADADPWVPLGRVKETAAAFEAIANSVSLTVYRDSAHHINDDAVRRIRQFLEDRMAG